MSSSTPPEFPPYGSSYRTKQPYEIKRRLVVVGKTSGFKVTHYLLPIDIFECYIRLWFYKLLTRVDFLVSNSIETFHHKEYIYRLINSGKLIINVIKTCFNLFRIISVMKNFKINNLSVFQFQTKFHWRSKGQSTWLRYYSIFHSRRKDISHYKRYWCIDSLEWTECIKKYGNEYTNLTIRM